MHALLSRAYISAEAFLLMGLELVTGFQRYFLYSIASDEFRGYAH